MPKVRFSTLALQSGKEDQERRRTLYRMVSVTPFVFVFVTYVLGINLVTGVLFWLDKRRAASGGRRVPEKRLLTLVAMGGSPAAQVARRKLRHKTQKQPFISHVRHIIQLQRIGLAAMAIVFAIWLL